MQRRELFIARSDDLMKSCPTDPRARTFPWQVTLISLTSWVLTALLLPSCSRKAPIQLLGKKMPLASKAATAGPVEREPLPEVSANNGARNGSPLLLVEEVIEGRENALISRTLVATDPEGDPLTFRCVEQCPTGLVLTAHSGLMTWLPDYSSAGDHPVLLEVSDGKNVVRKLFNLRIANVNRIPTLSCNPHQGNAGGSIVANPCTGTDPDGNETLVYAVTGCNVTVTPSGTFSGLTGQAPCQSQVTVTDGETDAHATFTITPSIGLAHAGVPLLFAETCAIQGTGTALFQPGVTFLSASAALAGATSLSGNATGYSGILTDLTPRLLTSTWTVGGSDGASSTLTQALRLESAGGESTVSLLAAPNSFAATATAAHAGGSEFNRGGCTTCERGTRGQMSAQGELICILISGGNLKCWGTHPITLPDGATAAEPVPVGVRGLGGAGFLSDLATIELGEAACGLTSGGEARCWGYGYDGRLGDGNSQSTAYPVVVTDGTTAPAFSQISLGTGSACGIKANGSLHCWGTGAWGVNGRNTDEAVAVPFPNAGAGRVKSVGLSRFGYHGCLVNSSDEVECWGHNSKGQLGYDNLGDPNDTSGFALSPVPGLTNVSKVEAGQGFSCALKQDGTVACWGENTLGELGRQPLTPTHVVGSVSNLASGVTQLALGRRFSCVLQGIAVKCWGYNGMGALGDGTLMDSLAPVTVPIAGTPVEIDAGGDFACARLTSGQVACWGNNEFGQLGNGSRASSPTPVMVTGLTDAVKLSLGVEFACAIRQTGPAVCWGRRWDGNLGDGKMSPQALTPVASFVNDVNQVAVGVQQICYVSTSGAARCIGGNGGSAMGSGVEGLRNVARNTFVSPAGLTSGVVAVSSGYATSCALTTSGGVKCWGSNYYGALGDNDVGDGHTPVNVSGLTSGVVGISSHDWSTCALMGDGTLKCWGNNNQGQLGAGNIGPNSAIPVAVAGLGGPVSGFSVGHEAACAVVGTGVKCWGRNNSGQLGTGDLVSRDVPTLVQNLSDVAIAVQVGNGMSCALHSNGSVSCWGDFDIGDGSSSPHLSARLIPGVSGATALAVGGNTACVLRTNGEVRCWGAGSGGQLGTGSTAYATSPTTALVNDARRAACSDLRFSLP